MARKPLNSVDLAYHTWKGAESRELQAFNEWCAMSSSEPGYRAKEREWNRLFEESRRLWKYYLGLSEIQAKLGVE